MRTINRSGIEDSDGENGTKHPIDEAQKSPATEESDQLSSVNRAETVESSSRPQSQENGGTDADADADDAKRSEKQTVQGNDDGTGGATAGEGSQPKRQKVEQQNEVPLLISGSICKDSKASLLVHLRDETLDLSGDTGAVGRIAVGGKKRGGELTFDLKGQQFSGQIIPSATVLVVGVGRTEAKIEGVFSEVCRLDYKRNVLDAMGGEVLKGEMDESYIYEEEDVNVHGRGGDGGGGEAGADDAGSKEGGAGGGGSGGKTPKSGRKKTSAKKKNAAKSSSSSSSGRKGAKASASKSKSL